MRDNRDKFLSMRRKRAFGSRFRRLRSLGRADRGVGTIEFAIVVPILCAMVLGITDLGRGVAFKLTLQQAAHRGLEYATVGTSDNAAKIQSEAAAAAGVASSQVTVTMWLECDGAKMTNYTDICALGQETARYVRLRVGGRFDPIFSYGPLGRNYAGAQADGMVPMTGSGVLRVQ